MLHKIKAFVQREVVLCAAVVLAVISAVIVLPDKKYIDYIDFRTLAILFCLMCVMAGLQKIGVFRWIAEYLLGRVHGNTQVILILVLLCFFFGMLITNDVALITFVPFTFTVGRLLGEDRYRRMVLLVVVLQTVAANLGSMMTPIGNPQNLYLYGISGMSTGRFILLMLPYTVLALVMVTVGCVLFGKSLERVEKAKRIDEADKTGQIDKANKVDQAGWIDKTNKADASDKIDKTDGAERAVREAEGKMDVRSLALYLVLFILCLLTVAHILPMQLMLCIVVVMVFFLDRTVFTKVDYCLLLTFVAFFVFIGNMGRVPAFAGLLENLVKGNEVLVAVVSSQLISNVPAALLLSGFTDNIPALIIGVNLGGMGTLIASMASLISYKYVAAEVQEIGLQKGRAKYLGYFTAVCLVFLAALSVLYLLVGTLDIQ